jgi:hypothetical protein
VSQVTEDSTRSPSLTVTLNVSCATHKSPWKKYERRCATFKVVCTFLKQVKLHPDSFAFQRFAFELVFGCVQIEFEPQHENECEPVNRKVRRLSGHWRRSFEKNASRKLFGCYRIALEISSTVWFVSSQLRLLTRQLACLLNNFKAALSLSLDSALFHSTVPSNHNRLAVELLCTTSGR